MVSLIGIDLIVWARSESPAVSISRLPLTFSLEFTTSASASFELGKISLFVGLHEVNGSARDGVSCFFTSPRARRTFNFREVDMCCARARNIADIYIELEGTSKVVVFVGPECINFVCEIVDKGAIFKAHFNKCCFCFKLFSIKAFKMKIKKSTFQIAIAYKAFPDCRLRLRLGIRVKRYIRFRVRVYPIIGHFFILVGTPLLDFNF